MSQNKITPEQKKFVEKNFYDAFLARDFETVDLCLKKGANINLRVFEGRTALQHAVYKFGDEAVVDYVLSKNPDLFLRTNDRYTETVFDLVGQVADVRFKKKMVEKFLKLLPDADHNGNILTPAFQKAAEQLNVGTQKTMTVPKKAVFKNDKTQNNTPPKKGFQR